MRCRACINNINIIYYSSFIITIRRTGKTKCALIIRILSSHLCASHYYSDLEQVSFDTRVGLFWHQYYHRIFVHRIVIIILIINALLLHTHTHTHTQTSGAPSMIKDAMTHTHTHTHTHTNLWSPPRTSSSGGGGWCRMGTRRCLKPKKKIPGSQYPSIFTT